ncbi:glycosyltransferase family 2 protein [Streptomyces sp. B1866]|uniref:dolichyl-phosphate beta-glucosyltransferase n=1 Tax=Streptomyces sp. B1866 TaxID=3075431 RepID=UPI00288EF618|nr:glycosyltransferase family 2 protein [Streptomyces sp. B1866]MDT3397419.1 glycosyltransferase family 2 protein [Streptomyces sp. B1866]
MAHLSADAVDLTVVVPAYNEEQRLRPTLDAIRRHLDASGRYPKWELIVVDDGSTDGTAAIVQEVAAADPRVRLLGSGDGLESPYTGNHGKGHAVRMGVLASRGRYVLLADADLATPIEELDALQDRLDEGHSAAIGSRAHPEARIEVRQHPARRALGQAGNRLIRALAVPGVRDTQCGFKLFDGDRARAAFGRSRLDGWGIDIEILRMFRRARWSISEVPVRWAHQTGSKIRALDYARVLADLARVRLYALGERLRPADRLALTLFLLGAVWLYKGLWMGPNHRYISDSGQDQNQWEWFFSVTAHNVGHLDNPLFTHLQNAPLGVNLMANTVMLGLSVPLAPVTALFGPGVTWALVLTGGLAGTAAAWYWLLVRRFVTSRLAAALGAALAAFAPPMISHANAHPNFAVLFMIPLIVDRLLRLCDRETARPVRDGVTLGLLLTYQIFLGEEPLLIACMAMLLFAVGYAAMRPSVARAALVPLGRGLGVALAVSLPLLAYPLYWQFFGDQSYHGLPHGPQGNSPRALVEFAGRSLAGDEATADRLAVNRTEQNAFFGWPLLALAAALLAALWQDVRVRALGFTAFVMGLLSLGRTIPLPWTDRELPGPWRLFADLPGLDSILESRLAMAAAPVLGILLALGCDRLAGNQDGVVRFAGWVAVVTALLPIVPTAYPTTDRTPVPSFIADGTWRSYVPRGRTLVPVPVPSAAGAEALHWQTTADLGFAIPQGYFVGPWGPDKIGVYGAVPRPTSSLLSQVRDTGLVPAIGPQQRQDALTDLAYWHAGALVLPPQPSDGALRETLKQLLGQPGEWVGGVWVWRLGG